MQNYLDNENIGKKCIISNRDSESVVIGSLLSNTAQIEKVLLYLRPEDFDFEVNRKIFACMINLHRKGVSIDPIIVFEELEKNDKSRKVSTDFDVNGYIETISTYATVDTIVETHCNIIRDCSMRRTVIGMVDDIARLATDGSVGLETLFDNVQNRVNLIENRYISKSSSSRDAGDIVRTISANIQNRNFTENDYISSGFVGLDNIINGFKKSDFVVIGSKTSVGKTSFALNIVNNLCQQNRSVGFFSIEVSGESLTMSFVSINSGVEYYKIENNSLMNENERDMYEKACSKIENYSFYIESTSNIQIHELKAQARKMKKEYGVEIIFIDRIRLISTSHNNMSRFEQCAFLSKNLRELSLELDIPIIVLCQLYWYDEGREPSLADLGEMESLEQDADIVILLHRENEEQQDNDEQQQQDNEEEVRKIKVIVAKNRRGAIGTATIGFEPKYTKFMDVGVG